MSQSIAETAEAFSRHQFARCYPYLADDVRWDIVGDRQIDGRTAVIDLCEESAGHLRTVRTDFSAFRVVIAADCVVTDSRATYVGPDGDFTTVASCDIYRFAGDRLQEITSYTVELTGAA